MGVGHYLMFPYADARLTYLNKTFVHLQCNRLSTYNHKSLVNLHTGHANDTNMTPFHIHQHLIIGVIVLRFKDVKHGQNFKYIFFLLKLK